MSAQTASVQHLPIRQILDLYRDVHQRLGDGDWNADGKVSVKKVRHSGLLAIFADGNHPTW